VRPDGVYVELEEDEAHERTVGVLVAETLSEWGVKWVSKFSDYAELCGAKGWHVEDAHGLEQAMKDALAYEGPSMVEIVTDPSLI